MEVEAQLDEDYLFYLNFTDTFLRRITDEHIHNKAKLWLYRLLGGAFEGVDQKRCRNIYLANLLISMQNNAVDGPFDANPFTVDLLKATDVFGPIPDTIEPPEWLNETEFDIQDDEKRQNKPRKGRTYVATRTLPNGQGAFAYVGVSLTATEPMWLGAGESSFDDKLQKKFCDMCPPENEMEKILARRKDPKEREKVLAFYDVLLQTIADELDGKDAEENEIVEGLLIQLIHDLNDKNQYEPYEELEEKERRVELLMLLFDRVKNRRDKVAKREEVLDNLEQQMMPKSFFEVSDPLPEDRCYFPAAMWEQAIYKLPERKHLNEMQKYYPVPVIEKFIQCMYAYKENIATRMQKRHENMVSQMKKEMRKEGERMKRKADEAETACNSALEVLDVVRAHYEKVQEAEKNNRLAKSEGTHSEHTKIYEAMKQAVFDQQRLVEEEALRGKFLAHQINAVSEQTEQYMHVNDDMIKKTEEANMRIMKNIKHLTAAIRRYELMITEMKANAQNQKKLARETLLII